MPSAGDSFGAPPPIPGQGAAPPPGSPPPSGPGGATPQQPFAQPDYPLQPQGPPPEQGGGAYGTPPAPSPPGMDEPVYEGPRIRADFEQPQLARVIGGMYLGTGIWMVIAGLTMVFLWFFVCPCIFWLGVLEIVLGGFCIKWGQDMLSEKLEPPNTNYAIGMIACILNCDPFTPILGIAILVMSADGKVQQYYRDIGRIA